jgi:hypothetical protein
VAQAFLPVNFSPEGVRLALESTEYRQECLCHSDHLVTSIGVSPDLDLMDVISLDKVPKKRARDDETTISHPKSLAKSRSGISSRICCRR